MQSAQFLRQVQNYSRTIFEYENPHWQSEARKVIPVQALNDRATAAIAAENDVSKRPTPRDALLKQLLHWFKFEFFQWTNQPPCRQCQGQTQAQGAVPASVEERQYGAGIAEIYRCQQCGTITRFPRYNNALKLLSTRNGRCGEWVQAFMLCARAMTFEARAVHDWTDHVWVEYYSEGQSRWIHCDPCEDAMDRPDLYETGWGKKLNYVVAFSIDDCVDVTRRYTKDYSAVKARRTLCPEMQVQMIVSMINLERWHRSQPARRAELLRRASVEQLELQGVVAINHTLQNGLLAGRTTGSVEWRRERGELGDERKTEQAMQQQQQQQQTAQQIQQLEQREFKSEKKEENDTVSTSAAIPSASSPASSSLSSSSASAVSGKEKVKLLFQRYRDQLMQGCGSPTCSNSDCASNPVFVKLESSAAIAQRALELTSKFHEVKLCNPNTARS